jgi:hypothetical protein
MKRETAIDRLDRLHEAHNDFYTGDSGATRDLVAQAIPCREPAVRPKRRSMRDADA